MPPGSVKRVMYMYNYVFNRAEPLLLLNELLIEAMAGVAARSAAAFRLKALPSTRGGTLRPGKDTPLWNELRAQIRPYLRRRGTQAQLGRILGMPRQRVNEYITRGRCMPDAERTLQLIAWLISARAGARPT